MIAATRITRAARCAVLSVVDGSTVTTDRLAHDAGDDGVARGVRELR